MEYNKTIIHFYMILYDQCNLSVLLNKRLFVCMTAVLLPAGYTQIYYSVTILPL